MESAKESANSTVASEMVGQGGLVPSHFSERGAEPPHFRSFLTSHAMNKYINASKEAMHLPVVQKPVAVAACESFTTQNRSKLRQYTALLCCARVYMTIFGHKFMNIN